MMNDGLFIALAKVPVKVRCENARIGRAKEWPIMDCDARTPPRLLNLRVDGRGSGRGEELFAGKSAPFIFRRGNWKINSG